MIILFESGICLEFALPDAIADDRFQTASQRPDGCHVGGIVGEGLRDVRDGGRDGGGGGRSMAMGRRHGTGGRSRVCGG